MGSCELVRAGPSTMLRGSWEGLVLLGGFAAGLTGTLGSPIANITDAGTLLFPEPAVHALHAAPHCQDGAGEGTALSWQPLGPRLPLTGHGCAQNGQPQQEHPPTAPRDGTHLGSQPLPHLASLV